MANKNNDNFQKQDEYVKKQQLLDLLRQINERLQKFEKQAERSSTSGLGAGLFGMSPFLMGRGGFFPGRYPFNRIGMMGMSPLMGGSPTSDLVRATTALNNVVAQLKAQPKSVLDQTLIPKWMGYKGTRGLTTPPSQDAASKQVDALVKNEKQLQSISKSLATVASVFKRAMSPSRGSGAPPAGPPLGYNPFVGSPSSGGMVVGGTGSGAGGAKRRGPKVVVLGATANIPKGGGSGPGIPTVNPINSGMGGTSQNPSAARGGRMGLLRWIELILNRGSSAMNANGMGGDTSQAMAGTAVNMMNARRFNAASKPFARSHLRNLNAKGAGPMGGAASAAQAFGSFINATNTGDQIGGLGGAMGGAISMIPHPAAQLAGTALTMFSKTIGKAINTIDDWNRHLRESNFQFAEYSAAMAQVQAEHEIRQIKLSKERGDSRAGWAKEYIESADRFDRAMAPIRDGLDQLSETFKNVVRNAASEVIEALFGKNEEKQMPGKFGFMGENPFRDVAELEEIQAKKDRPNWF